ncbi:MAG TPA: SDR family oxidoreductase [Vicinamibacterales bacterium]|nr:SDR family oxidoreductase [Vicinamibacterales bacterium]
MSPARFVVVTGASSGIGFACAQRLDQAGFRVFGGVRREADGDRLRAATGGRAVPLRLDITDADQIAAAARTVDDVCGEAGLAGLVNNAGIAIAGPLECLPIDDLRRQLEVNVIGQVAVTQALLPALRRGRGRIVNMGSIAGRFSAPFLGPYSASKFALEAITDALRLELRPWGLAVVIVEPGDVATPIWEKGQQYGRELEARLPEAVGRYEPFAARVRRYAAARGRSGAPPDLVARVVLRALTARRPRPRYLVGRDAQVRAILARWLPDRARDWLVARLLGLRPAAGV